MERRHPLAKCEECSLNDPKNTFVPSAGPADADIVVVGEAPGFKESKTGVPFSGPSGKLLDTVFGYHNIERKDTCVTNVCLCRPPGNRTPTKAEIAACNPRLMAELANAKKIVALGNTAAAAVMGESVKITSFRVGPPKKSPLYPNAEVIASFHPAACLRAADNFPHLVNDIAKINGHRTIGFKEPTYRVFEDVYEASRVVQELMRFHTLVIDIETNYDKDATYEPSHRIDPLCIGVAYEPTKVVVFSKEVVQDKGWQRLFDQLLTRAKLVCHNGKYDLAWLQDISPGCRLFFDTMLASYCLDERPGVHSLDYLGIEILGTPNWKKELKQFGDKMGGVPLDNLFEYNAYDCAVTWQLYEHFTSELKTQGLLELHDFLVRASNELMHMEREGIAIDLKFLDELEERFHRELREAEAKLARWVANPRSTPQVKRACEALGIDEENTRKETFMNFVCDELNYDDPVFRNDIEVLLESLALAEHNERSEFIWRMLSYRKEQKLYGTYIKGTRKRLYGGRLYPTFLLHGTTVGRLSCRNPNVQNIPRGSSIRNLFVPEKGKIFVQGDYSQAELRTIAALAEDSYLQGIFRGGRDIHTEVAKQFYGENISKEQRVKAKMVVFGLSYDMSYKGLAKRMGISDYEAKKFIKAFFEVIPDVEAWRQEVQRQVFQESEDLISPFGRHRRFWLITKENRNDIKREALAFFPQTIASDICLIAFTRLRPMLAGIASFRITVHDSLLAECAPKDVDTVSRVMKEEMEKAALEFTDFVPFQVDIATGASWGNLS